MLFGQKRNLRTSSVSTECCSSLRYVTVHRRHCQYNRRSQELPNNKNKKSSGFATSRRSSGRLSTIGSLQLNLSGHQIRSSVGVIDALRAISNSSLKMGLHQVSETSEDDKKITKKTDDKHKSAFRPFRPIACRPANHETPVLRQPHSIVLESYRSQNQNDTSKQSGHRDFIATATSAAWSIELHG